MLEGPAATGAGLRFRASRADHWAMSATWWDPRGRAANAIALSATIGLLAAAPAHARAALPESGDGRVISVDGPGRVTLKTAGKRVRMRIGGLDMPEPARTGAAPECGAGEATAALKAMVAGKRLRYDLVPSSRKGGPRFAVDPDRRSLVSLAMQPTATNSKSVAAALVRKGWARYGVPVGLTQQNSTAAETPTTYEEYAAAATNSSIIRGAPAGIWTICGGRIHLPGGQPVPPTQPTPWSVDADGILHSIGGIELSPDLSPGAVLTPAKLQALVGGVEVTLVEEGCAVYVPAYRVAFSVAASFQSVCGDQPVQGVLTYGPGAITLDRGLKSSDAPGRIPTLFPRTAGQKGLGNNYSAIPLSGPHPYPWAWQTAVQLDGHRRIAQFVATAASRAWD
jgi:endonuclease YncB( thermonuclease family)